MDLFLDNIVEVQQIRILLDENKKLLDFFNDLVAIKNIEINYESIINEYSMTDTDEEYTDTDTDDE
jgi:hypothetical protein